MVGGGRCQEQGRVTQDVNGYQQEGFGPFDRNMDPGERASTAHAFINSARSRPNLGIRTDTVVSKVLLEGRRARGVVCSSDGGAETEGDPGPCNGGSVRRCL